ncbi:alpha/beta hydrolase [Paenibacillus sp.]|uniref:alpha/beta hydrolase n=1 Tax=Paenibacillus sp. TaxID=58172 RepID=UPI0028AD3453|nr:alpha/beta hydrolase [Paenibacillus sp.]
MERKYSQQLLTSILERQHVINENGLDILIKPIPETDEPGVLDPRFYQSMESLLKGFKGMLVKMMLKGSRKKNIQKSAAQMRRMMNGVNSIPITDGVDVKHAKVQNGDVAVPVRIYTPQKKSEGLQPVFYYIHGGGFVAGGPDVVEEMCKLVVANTGCVSIQVDYRLAPENPYPAGLDDCYAVLKWVYAHAEEFNGDPNRICISGDSAGGNLATVCAMKDRDEGTQMVKAQALLYPSVDAAGMKEHMQRRDVYEISPSQDKQIRSILDLLSGGLGTVSLGEYLGVPDDTIPHVSPLRGDLIGMPPTVILFGEYDFLRIEDDAYALKLKESGVKVKTVRYKGLSHGFADQVGVTPQAEDSLNEIGKFMLENV